MVKLLVLRLSQLIVPHPLIDAPLVEFKKFSDVEAYIVLSLLESLYILNSPLGPIIENCPVGSI